MHRNMNVSTFYGRRTVRRLRTIADAMEDIQSDDIHADTVVILPPAAGDSSADSDTEPLNDNDLQNDQVFEPSGEIEIEYEEPTEAEENSALSVKKPSVKKRKTTKHDSSDNRNASKGWQKTVNFERDFTDSSVGSLSETYPMLKHLTPMAYFDFVFDESMFKLLADQTSLYAKADKNDPNFTITVADVRQFCGVLLLSGYHTLPEEFHYWSNQMDLGVTLVSEAMSSKRFQAIKRYFHAADNRQLEQGNKVAKVKPLYDALNKNLTQFGVFHEHLSIDESMVPYFGRHSCKMFIRGKPIRFGFKIWVMAGKDGYPYHLQIYTGREQNERALPLGTRVVQHMIAAVDAHTTTQRHHLFFDNFFTSYQLLKELADNGIRATGTVREFRTSKCCCLLVLDL